MFQIGGINDHLVYRMVDRQQIIDIVTDGNRLLDFFPFGIKDMCQGSFGQSKRFEQIT
jgi:hypothetical protein